MSKPGKIARVIAAAGASVVLSLTLAVAPAQASGTAHGCPAGWACLYPNASWNNDQPSLMWYSYGAHNLSNQFGWKRLFNNQTGGALVYTCLEYNGNSCGNVLGPGWWQDRNYDPVNSVLLTP